MRRRLSLRRLGLHSRCGWMDGLLGLGPALSVGIELERWTLMVMAFDTPFRQA